MKRTAAWIGALVMMVLASLAWAAPAAAAPGDALTLVFARGADDAVWFRVRDESTGATWQPWRTLGGAVTGTPSGELLPDGRLAVFGRGLDGAVWMRTSWDAVTWDPWTSLGGFVLDDPTVVFTPWLTNVGEPDLVVVGRGGDRAIWTQSFAGTTGTWSGWRPVPMFKLRGRPYAWADEATRTVNIAGTIDAGGYPGLFGGALMVELNAAGAYTRGRLIGGPGIPGPYVVDAPVMTNDYDTLLAFSRDLNGHLVGRDDSWPRWDDLGGVITHAPQFGPVAGDLATALGRGQDGGAWWFGPDGWTSLGGLVRESPTGAEVGLDRFLLTARGADDGVWIRWFDAASGGWTGWESLGGLVRNAPSELTVYAVDDAAPGEPELTSVPTSAD